MRTEKVHTLILGAGPAGLAAGYTLAKAGLNPVTLERDKVCGGLMRSIRRGDFVVDVGRKELYNRLERVDRFWRELLGADYRSYPHRGGFLFDGHILEMSPSFRGFRRGMPWSMFLGCLTDLLWNRIKPWQPKPANVEQYFYQKRGRRITRIAAQGFQEKLTGVKWADIEIPEDLSDTEDSTLLGTLKAGFVRAFSRKEVNTFNGVWKHPAKGTGQICDRIAERMVESGGVIHYRAQVKSLKTAPAQIQSVTADLDGETIEFQPEYVVSSAPLEVLLMLMGKPVPPAPERKGVASLKRTVILVYLFLDRPPLFPHAWLQATCPSTRMGRITNYDGFNGDMVPAGKGCICCEYYAYGEDALLGESDESMRQATIADCVRMKLIESNSCKDALVLRLPGADASQNRDNWMSARRLALLTELAPFQNLFCVNRTETDIATLAGLEAGEAILKGDRTEFEDHVNPAALNIRSESKAFSFDLPVSTQP